MDPIAQFLDSPRARDAFLLHVLMEPPWSMDVADDAPLTMVAVLSGRICLRVNGSGPVQLDPGAVVLVRAGYPYVLGSDAQADPTIGIGPGQVCTSQDGLDLSEPMSHGLRQWGNDAHGRDTMLVASYLTQAEVGRMLVRALPPMVVLPSMSLPYLDLLVQEVQRDDLAQAAMLDRLLDIVLVSVIRHWATNLPEDQRSWLAAARDDAVLDVVRTIHERPEQTWTVDELAASVGLSRAALTRRFTKVVGESPIAYLTQWRLARAADLLTTTEQTLEAIARRVGYASPFSLSAAFKKEYGQSPSDYRAQQVPVG